MKNWLSAACFFATLVSGQTTKETTKTVDTRACQAPHDKYDFCDTSLPLDARVQSVIDEVWKNKSWIPPMLTARHAGGGGSPGPSDGIPSLGIQEFDWGLNCAHGVQSSCVESKDGKVHCPTSFPNTLNAGAYWDDSLTLAMGKVIATEARALWVAGAVETSTWSGRPHIAPECWSPNININRDPRWGRNEEVASEDPLVNGRFGAAYAKGTQLGEDSRYIKTITTLKHWDGYSLEDSDGKTRHNFNAQISNYSLASTYFPAWRRALIDGGAAGVMCSYNAVNGKPSCANDFLSSVLRDTWNYTGYITSDTGAIEDVYQQHKYVKTEAEAACVSIVDGTTDVCSGHPYHNQILTCPSAAINASLARTLRLRFQMGMFDPIEDQPYWEVPLTAVNTPAAQALNLMATQKSIILLKHDGKTLPLKTGQTLAVLGPHANSREAQLGNYLGQICPSNGFDCVSSPAEAIQRFNVGGTTLVGALNSLTKNDTAGWIAALEMASKADVVVLALGIDGSLEGESHDRSDIDLPAVQHAFAAAVAQAAAGKPIATILLHGGSIDTSPERDNPNIGAIVDGLYAGFLAAEAFAQTLFGANPYLGGKLATTQYLASYTKEISMSEMELDVGVGRGYRYYGGPVAYPFGHGLSLTTFTLSGDLPTSAFITETSPSSVVKYTATVKNTGSVSGDEVIQAYFLPQSTPSQPKSRLLKQLFDFRRVSLKAGESTTVTFSVSSETLRLNDRETGNLVSTPGEFTLLFTNGLDFSLKAQAKVTGSEVTVATFPY